MNRSVITILLTGFVIFFSSCVAKKKYLEMEKGRLNAEQKVRELTTENNAKAERIKTILADYEKLKAELLGSNAVKDQYIDSLNKEVFILRSNISQKSETMEEKNYAFEFEKRRLNNTLVERDRRIKSMQAEITRLENNIKEKTITIEQGEFDLNEAKNELKVMEGLKQRQEESANALEGRLKKSQDEVAALKAQMKEKDAEITRLSNTVKLLKKELGS